MDDQQRQLLEELIFSEKRKAGLGSSLFTGRIETDQFLPYPQPTEQEQKRTWAFLNQVREFIEKEVDPVWIDTHAEIPEKVTKGLAQLGVMGMTVPEAFGGLNMPQHAYCKLTEMVAGRCASTALYINVHQSIGLKALLLFGTPKQKETWLPGLASGEVIAAFALTEPNAGSDAGGIETRAVYDPMKNVYRINGKKQWSTNGGIAGVITVMAKTEVDTPKGKQEKVTAFLVTPDMPGFKVTAKALSKVGMRGTHTANLEFTDMEVPYENILGPIGGGLKVALTVLDYGRTTFGASCTGAAKFCLSRAIEHARSRYQFKRPLAAFGLVKKMLARMAALTYAMDAATYLTAGMIDAGKHDIMLESAMLKVFASDSLWRIIYDTMQIFGGRSFFTDHPFERMMRDARLNMIGEGSNEVMRAFIGAVGMRDVGMELKGFVDALKNPIKEGRLLGKFLTRHFSRLLGSKIKVRSPELRQEAELLAKVVKQLGASVVSLLKHYREEIVEQELELARIADSAMAAFTMAAVIGKLDATLSGEIVPEGNKEHEIAAGKLYCRLAANKVKRKLGKLFCKDDADIEALSDLLTGIGKA